MDSMRQEIWERAKNRLRQEATENATNGKLWEVILTMDSIEEQNLIFGSPTSRKEKSE